ncbi:MAG: hypothetical protein Kow00105_15550 [Phycisphaeraceae bacterium]
MHVLWVFDAATGLIVDFIEAECHRHDLADASKMHPLMQEGDVLLGDRPFGTYADLPILLQGQLYGVFRMHQRLIVDFTPGRKSKRHKRKRHRKDVPTSRYPKRL